MALPGLNTEGTRISVLPTYTPSRTALDLSDFGSGFQQGLGVVQQAGQLRRLRDLELENAARRPLRDLQMSREMVELGQPIERVTDVGIEETPLGGTFLTETVQSIDPITRAPSTSTRRARVIETPGQAALRSRESRALAPLRELVQNADGTYDAVLISREPGSEGVEVGRVKGVTPQQSFVPDAPKPDYIDAGVETVMGPNGQAFRVATVTERATGRRFYRVGEQLLPFDSAPAPKSGGGDDSVKAWFNKTFDVNLDGAQSGGVPTLPGVGAPVAQPQAPATPVQNIIRVDPSRVYGPR